MRRACASAAATEAAGEDFAEVVASGDVVLLSGPLGAGKTTFVRGLARGLGVLERATSPTFTMVREHRCHNDRGIETLHHADLYRVGSLDEVLDLALGELVEEQSIAVIEWGEIAAPLFGADVLAVDIEVVSDDERLVRVGGALAARRAAALARWSA